MKKYCRMLRNCAVFMVIFGGAMFFTSCENLAWTRFTVTVTFDANGGTGNVPSSQSVRYSHVESASVILPSGSGLSRSGFVFSGWSFNRNPTHQNQVHQAGSNFRVSRRRAEDETITLYAIWRRQ